MRTRHKQQLAILEHVAEAAFQGAKGNGRKGGT